MERKTGSVEEVIEAFWEGRELRVVKVSNNMGPAWWGGDYAPQGIRDQVKVYPDRVEYLLWDSPIAVRSGNILTLNNCGYETNLTRDRMGDITGGLKNWTWRNERVPWVGKANWGYSNNIDLPFPLKINILKGEPFKREVLKHKEFLISKLMKSRAEWRFRYIYKICEEWGLQKNVNDDELNAKLVTMTMKGVI